MDLDGLIRQGFLTNIGESFIVARAGIRWAIMLGAANADQQGGKKDQDTGISAKLVDQLRCVVSVNDCSHDRVFRIRDKYSPAPVIIIPV